MAITNNNFLKAVLLGLTPLIRSEFWNILAEPGATESESYDFVSCQFINISSLQLSLINEKYSAL